MRVSLKTTLCAAAVATSALGASPTLAACQFTKLGEMAVDMSRGVPMVEIEANGQKRKVVLRTGSNYTTLRKADIIALGGGGGTESNLVSLSARGERTVNYSTLKEVKLGGAFRVSRLEVLVNEDTGASDIAGYIGADILAAADVEFDLAHNRVAFYTPKDCAKDYLGYWEGAITDARLVTAVASRRAIQLGNLSFRPAVSLNGKETTAELNSGSGISVVDAKFASLLGLKPGAPGVRTTVGMSLKPVMVGKFTEFAIGGEKISNPSFVMDELFSDAAFTDTGSNLRTKIDGLPTMILGLDFMRSHRILVASSQRRMYFSHNGGPVFRTPPAQ
jgi:hypothetical protein